MKNKFLLLMIFILNFFIYHQESYANVDQTNAYTFTYDCNNGQGILHTKYNLGGHHLYYRDYKINTPGIISVGDAEHTTVDAASLISIDGCGYEASSCNIYSVGTYSFYKSEIYSTLDIITNLDVTKTGNQLFINGDKNGTNNTITDSGSAISTDTGTTNTWNNKNYSITLKTLSGSIDLSGKDVTITLNDYGYEISTNKGNYNNYKFNYPIGTGVTGKEYTYTFNNNNKSIEINRNIFKRVSTGNTDSISGEGTRTYSSFSGTNTGDSTCADPKTATTNYGYCTGLDYWDYNQHNYTTTKVQVNSVKVGCEVEDFSDGSSNINTKDFNGTLAGVIQPQFGGDITLSGKYGNSYLDSFNGANIMATPYLNIKGLEYLKVGEVAGNKLGVNKLIISIKTDDYTKATYSTGFTLKNTAGLFQDFNGVVLKNSSGVPVTQLIGTYQLVFSFYNTDALVGTYSFPLTVLPGNTLKANGTLSLSGTTLSASNVYADGGETKYTYCGNLVDEYGNVLYAGISLNRNVNTIITSGKNTDTIYGNGSEGITVDGYINNSNGKLCFDYSSYVPFSGSISYKYNIQKHNLDYSLINDYSDYVTITTPSLNFKKPYIGTLLASKDGTNYNVSPDIGTSLKYKISLTKKGTFSPTNFYFNDYKNYITGTTTSLNIQGIDLLTTTNPSTFSARINTTTNSSTTPGLKIVNSSGQSPLIITYTIDGKMIKYYLSTQEAVTDKTPLSIIGSANSFVGLKVVGSLQATGKQELTGQESNFTDLSKSELRTQIRKNAYTFISSMTSGQIVNGVKYVEGDYTISSNPSGYETLVVKNGNVIIKSNITNTKFGIIVLKDGYDVNNGFEAGNIVVSPNVTSLNGLFYADGGFVSGDASGEVYTIDSSTRTNALKNQLTLNGSLFTRNTIGGAILGTSGKYILPGGALTTDFNKAMVYDLNYVRRDDSGATTYTNYGFVLKANSSLTSNPPKLFTTN